MEDRQAEQEQESSPSSPVLVAVAWTLVGLPLAWGIYRTLQSAMVLFR